jgi:pilus assembly protein Flp/PilA
MTRQIRRMLSALHADGHAVTAIEYGMIAALIAVVVVSGFRAIGTSLSSVLSTVGNSF